MWPQLRKVLSGWIFLADQSGNVSGGVARVPESGLESHDVNEWHCLDLPPRCTPQCLASGAARPRASARQAWRLTAFSHDFIKRVRDTFFSSSRTARAVKIVDIRGARVGAAT